MKSFKNARVYVDGQGIIKTDLLFDERIDLFTFIHIDPGDIGGDDEERGLPLPLRNRHDAQFDRVFDSV